MVILQESDRQAATDEFMRRLSAVFEALGAVNKTDIRNTFNALDDYFEANQAAINQAIPQPARAQLTTKQKAFVAMLVLQYRYKVF